VAVFKPDSSFDFVLNRALNVSHKNSYFSGRMLTFNDSQEHFSRKSDINQAKSVFNQRGIHTCPQLPQSGKVVCCSHSIN